MAEVVPSSSLVKIEVMVGVEVEVEIGVEVGAEVEVGVEFWVGVGGVVVGLTFLVGWGGWLEKVEIKLNSTQVVVEVEVKVELGKRNVKGQILTLKKQFFGNFLRF